MRKLWTLALKEVKMAFRDGGAIVAMLVTPLALTLAMLAAFGSGNGGPISDIPVLLLNQDRGDISETLVDVFQSESVGDLVLLEIVDDEADARARVEADEVAALVIIPPDFTDRAVPILSAAQSQLGIDLTALDSEESEQLSPEQQAAIAQLYTETMGISQDNPVVVEIYASPEWRIGAAVVKGIVSQGLEMLNIQIAGISNIAARLFAASPTAGSEPTQLSQGLQNKMDVENAAAELPIKLDITSPTGRAFSYLGYYSTSMAVLFLMFAVTSGGRTLLAEREWGTLPRLLITPTPALTILLGKMGGIVLTGTLQVLTLWGATALIGAYWGTPPAVLITILALVLAASSIGAAISAWSKTPGQAGAIGTAITLTGSAISGSFFARWGLPTWVQQVSLFMPNAWGIEIFARLQAGKGLAVIAPWLAGLLLLTAIYYGVALVGFRRQFES